MTPNEPTASYLDLAENLTEQLGDALTDDEVADLTRLVLTRREKPVGA